MPKFMGRKRKAYRKRRKKPVSRKKVDKFQDKQLAKLKKDVRLLKSVKEPLRLQKHYVKHDLNGTDEADQLRLTKHGSFVTHPEDSALPASEFRSGTQVNIGNLNIHLTLWDINNAFRWRVMIVQYKERPNLHRASGDANNYNTNAELDDILKWHDTPSELSDLERLNWNMISPVKMKKEMSHSVHILYDRTFTGKNRSIKVAGVDNQIVTIPILVKPKMHKLTFLDEGDDSPYRGDIVAYVWNDYPYSGARSNGYLGLDQTNHPEKKKGYSMMCHYNVYDDT